MDPLLCAWRPSRTMTVLSPGSGCEKAPVGFGIDEDVVEHGGRGAHVHGLGRIAHVDAGSEIDPFAVVRGREHIAVFGVRGAYGSGGLDWLGAVARKADSDEDHRAHEN